MIAVSMTLSDRGPDFKVTVYVKNSARCSNSYYSTVSIIQLFGWVLHYLTGWLTTTTRHCTSI